MKSLSRFGTPTEVEYCKRCVISNQRPSSVVEFKSKPTDQKETIIFSDEGVCQPCEYSFQKDSEIDWNHRKEELHKLCDRFRAKKIGRAHV